MRSQCCLCVYVSPIVVRQRLSKHIPLAMSTDAIEELLVASVLVV
jgi:hypothetical protein